MGRSQPPEANRRCFSLPALQSGRCSEGFPQRLWRARKRCHVAFLHSNESDEHVNTQPLDYVASQCHASSMTRLRACNRPARAARFFTARPTQRGMAPVPQKAGAQLIRASRRPFFRRWGMRRRSFSTQAEALRVRGRLSISVLSSVCVPHCARRSSIHIAAQLSDATCGEPRAPHRRHDLL